MTNSIGESKSVTPPKGRGVSHTPAKAIGGTRETH